MHVIRQTKIAILDILIQLPFNVDSSFSTEKTAISLIRKSVTYSSDPLSSRHGTAEQPETPLPESDEAETVMLRTDENDANGQETKTPAVPLVTDVPKGPDASERRVE